MKSFPWPFGGRIVARPWFAFCPPRLQTFTRSFLQTKQTFLPGLPRPVQALGARNGLDPPKASATQEERLMLLTLGTPIVSSLAILSMPALWPDSWRRFVCPRGSRGSYPSPDRLVWRIGLHPVKVFAHGVGCSLGRTGSGRGASCRPPPTLGRPSH